MKYPNTKRERNAKIVAMRESKPEPPWREIAEAFGISKQRAQKIYAEQKGKE